jgi:transposase
MRDTTLYQHLLGMTEPWAVSRVDLDVAAKRVDIWVEHPKGMKWPCPECGAMGSLHDHAAERVWRHLDSCQFQTLLHADPPRMKCPEHGVRQVRLPWAEPHARFTVLFEAFAIQVLEETSIQAARKILGISWDEAWHLMHRATARGLARKKPREIRYYGVDEKSAGRGQKNYVTVICDLIQGTVEEVTEGREKRSLLDYLEALTKEQREAIAAVSMDMCDAYIYAVCDGLPDGRNKIVFDRFHIMQHMGKAVDQVRRQEHRVLSEQGNDVLANTRYVWLYSRENLPSRYWEDFYALKDSDLKTARAWAIKENLRNLWNYKTLRWAEPFWKRWYFWATHSRLEPVKAAARTIKNHLYGILSYFEHPITNAMSEGINSKIATIWKAACGYRNKQRFRTAILFHLGGLDLAPSTH